MNQSVAIDTLFRLTALEMAVRISHIRAEYYTVKDAGDVGLRWNSCELGSRGCKHRREERFTPPPACTVEDQYAKGCSAL